ncbi:hypothetical protein H0H92_003893 [Tricholoma furcatifolium]|nr:hypothetical protein H0H92_003893 [Tricholoma furcatifolium]
MDELLHHCLRELSFDGDLGCNVSRLRDFIVDFYAHSGTPQNPDDAFCAFVWSLVVQQPTVRVGTVPPGVTSEVWIAPQISAKRKAKAKGEEHVEVAPTELVLVSDARSRSLNDLKEQYGSQLRIAVDPDAIYAAITGSHIRFAKLSPMVYSALQIITRGRENGVTVVELGQQSKYDQKTCFYLVRQLTELDLVVKVRRGGVGTHFVIHRHFFDRSPHWKAIREEENQAENFQKTATEATVIDIDDDEEKSTDVQSLDFTPIDARHLSSLPLVRGRVVKLLKASKNQMHASNNMLITIGFANPTKTDRRFFQSRIREMIQQGVIEKVVVPSNKRKSVNSSVKCFRLVSKDREPDVEGVVVQSQDGDDDEKDVGEQSCVKMNITIHKQIFDLLEESGMTGMTLNELSAALCQFDKRTIELLLARAEKFPPPPHLSDLGIAGLMETSGRERRHRYFTVASYRQLVAKEKLDNSSAGYPDIDLSDIGGFLPVDSNLFYENETILHQYQDDFKEEKPSGKKRNPKNPVLPDGTVKQGRPRKYPDGKDPKSLRKKRKLETTKSNLDDPMDNEQPPQKKRKVGASGEAVEPPEAMEQTQEKCSRSVKGKQKEVEQPEETPLPKRQGRVRKGTSADLEKDSPVSRRASSKKGKTSAAGENTPTSKKRGRKKTDVNVAEEPPHDVVSGDEANSGPSKRTRLASESMEVPESMAIDTDQPSNGPTRETVSDIPACSSPAAEHIEGSISAQTIAQTTVASEPGTRSRSPHTIPTPGVQTNQTLQTNALTQSNLIRSSALLDSNTIPIDPALATDVLDYAQQMLRDVPPINSAPTRLEILSQINTLQTLPAQLLSSDVEQKTLTNNDPKLHATSKGTRVNVSHLRRENELFRVVQRMGGIINIQTKDFFEEHLALLEEMTKAGEPTSAPVGTRTDKRTVVFTFNNLENRGRIKQLRTSVMTHTGVRRPACIIYLPETPQEKLNAFLAELSRGVQSTPNPGNFVKIDEHVEYGADATSIPRGALPLQLLQMEQPGDDRKERWSKNMARAEQLFSYDDTVIRDVLLTERTTLAQLYGFMVGKAVRCREFHLSTLDAFEKGNPSSNIISHEKRIVDISFFCHDIPLGLYCSLVSSLSHNDELTRFIATADGRETAVRDLPPNINTTLQIGRSRGRSRFLDILETLRALKLVTPLQASNSEAPWITCEEREGRPNAFDVAPLEGWTISTPMAAPMYWHFNDLAPIHVWAASETSPPFWQDVPVRSIAHAMHFWDMLREASSKTDIPISPNAVSATGPPTVPISVARSLRRHVSWNSEYILTWHQSQYLKQFADSSTGKTPLQDEEEGKTQIEKISWVISAPQQTVEKFFYATHMKLLRDLEKLRKKASQTPVEKKAKKAAATKASLAKKAAEARLQREEEWDAMVHRLYPEQLEPAADVRVRRIRVRFLQAGSTVGGKWEDEIIEAVREANMVTKRVLKVPSKRTFPARAVPVPMDSTLTVAVNPPEKPVEVLIAMQGPPFVPHQDKVKRKRKGKNSEGSSFIISIQYVIAENATVDEPVEPKPKTLRRHRFQWNRDYEELARDASAIIRARCRNLPRLDWAAFEQVFPSVPRNTVRQRLAHIRETPGNEAYLSRLEDRWYELWMQHRGTSLLPDDDPTSASNFNLIKHVEFLRQHVDKNALRVGFAQQRERGGTVIPAAVDFLLAEYDVVENTPSVPPWDFVWNAVVEEGREKRMLRQPFLNDPEDMPSTGETPLEPVSVAEASLKMTLGTPHERYDPELASTLLRGIGEHHVSVATKNLLSRGVLSKVVRDPQKQKPGRQLKISEMNQNAIGGAIPRDTFQDAIALEELSLQDNTWREWPLLATDGDSAALIQLVSDNKVEFKVDTSHAQSCRPVLDWNSKKADDDQIETAIHVRTTVTSVPQPQPTQSLESSPGPLSLDLPADANPAHGQSVDGGIASCRQLSGIGLTDCMVCLEDEWVSFNDSLSPEERELTMHVLTTVRHGAEHGVTKNHLRVSYYRLRAQEKLSNMIPDQYAHICDKQATLFNGQEDDRVVCSIVILVLVSENPATRILPRRWLDISGRKVVDFWEAAVKAVMGVVVFRPGLTQAELRWRLRSVYDRQEVGDIVRSLLEDGSLKMRSDPAIEWNDNLNVAALDDREEKGVFWFVGEDKHWLVRSRRVSIHSLYCFYKNVNMRVKQLRNYVPIPSSSKLVWDRITFSRLTIAYFVFSILHFIIQLSLQIKAFTTNADAATFLNNIVVQGNGTEDSLPILSGNTLHLCSWVSSDLNLDDDSCPVVWNGTTGLNTVSSTQSEDESISSYQLTMVTSVPVLSSSSIVASASSAISDLTTSTSVLASTSAPSSSTITSIPTVTGSLSTSTVTVFVTATSSPIPRLSSDDDADDNVLYRPQFFERDAPQIVSFEENGNLNVNISGLGSVTTLDSSCVLSLNWPVSMLHNTKREDIVFMAFQFWVLGMSVVALLNESIPHIWASLVTHMMATAWAGFQIQHTAEFKADFTRVITEGACNGVSLLPNYWHDRGIAEINSLAFNALALLISSFLTWRLFKTFGWQTFKRVGASLTINRIYMIVLTLSITIQLSIFFMVVTVSLWLDQLFNSAIGDLVDFKTLYKVTSFITLMLLIPWLTTEYKGWFAVRRELRLPMFIFLVLSILYLGGWGVMFFSTTFRWNFVTWTFFGIMAVASFLLTIASLVLGIVCRYNFGKGLLRYLKAQQNGPEDFEYYGGASDEEKVDFPSNEKPVPTYASLFGAGLVASLEYNAMAPQYPEGRFESAKSSPVTPPPNAYTVTRKVSDSNSIARVDTRSSDGNFGTLASFYSYSAKGHDRSDSQKRWVIE